jgi:hypothetical protein
LLSCKPLKWSPKCSQSIVSKCGTGPASKSMQVCFVRGVGSPRSHASNLAHVAQVGASLRTITQGLREPARTHMKAQWTQSFDHADPNLTKRTSRAHVVGSDCLTTSKPIRNSRASSVKNQPSVDQMQHSTIFFTPKTDSAQSLTVKTGQGRVNGGLVSQIAPLQPTSGQPDGRELRAAWLTAKID